MRFLIPHLVATAAISLWPNTLLAQSRSDDSAVVANVVRQFHDALAQGDSGAALALLADDAVVLESGAIESRAEYRRHHLPADIRFVQAVPSTQGVAHVVVSGDVAWVSSNSETIGTFEGRPINSVGAELIVLSRTVRGWLIRAIHWSSRRRAGP